MTHHSNRVLLCFLLVAHAAFAGSAGAEPLLDAEQLARRSFHHGVPIEEARDVGTDGIERLGALLRDSGEPAVHAQVITILGMTERPEAFSHLARYAAKPLRDEVTLETYRARIALPYALGHLARTERQALWLLQRMLRSTPPLTWSYGKLRGARLRAQLRRGVIMGLAISGLPEATEDLRAELAQLPENEAEARGLRAHLTEALELCERVHRDGAQAVFGRKAG